MNAQFSIRIPDELMERVKVIANEKGTTIPALIRDLLNKYADQTCGLEERVRRVEIAIIAMEEEIQKLNQK